MLFSFLAKALLLKLVAGVVGSPAPSVTSPEWEILNRTVGGRLQMGIPFALPCFSNVAGVSNVPNQTRCTEIQSKYDDHLFRSNQFGAYEITQWETCQSTGDECLLDWTSPSNKAAFEPPRQCLQGGVPSYYIDVSGPDDVTAALDFANKTKVPLVIKNSGHDYIGRSSGPGSLALWMHNLDKLVLNEDFVPDECPSTSVAPTSAITIGAGQQFRAIYDFALDNNVTFLGGADPSVGASGGWVMGGGHSALSPSMGLGVDRVLEFKIVTPDGQYCTVNKCQNKDLFFALRGGGGGTFGVVMESTFIASPRVTIQTVLGVYNNTRGNSVKLLGALSWSAVRMATDGWGGYITPSSGTGLWANPLLSSENAKTSAASVVKAFSAVNGTTTFFVMDSYTDFFDSFIAPSPDAVTRPQVLASLLITSDKFVDDVLIDAMIDGILDSNFGQILTVGALSFKDFNDDDTSVNPVWRSTVWHSLMGYYWNFNSTLSDCVGQYQKLTKKMAMVRDHTPDAGAYFNEADVYEPNHTQSFWGTNYAKLLSIKQIYDPDQLLDCWRCVGWKGALDLLYQCYATIS